PGTRAARAERQRLVAGGPGVVRRHRRRPARHLRRRQRGLHPGTARGRRPRGVRDGYRPGRRIGDHASVRTPVTRLLAVLFALTWLVFPGFGLIDLSVSWDEDWPVVLEAGWGAVMTVLVGGSFLAVAVRPTRTAPALAMLLVTLA